MVYGNKLTIEDEVWEFIFLVTSQVCEKDRTAVDILYIYCSFYARSSLYRIQYDCEVHVHDGVLGMFPRGCCASSLSDSFAFSF